MPDGTTDKLAQSSAAGQPDYDAYIAARRKVEAARVSGDADALRLAHEECWAAYERLSGDPAP